MCRNISAISSSSFSPNTSRSPCEHKSSIRAKEREREKKNRAHAAHGISPFVCLFFSQRENPRDNELMQRAGAVCDEKYFSGMF